MDKFPVLTWQFPVLAKYHVPKLGRAPFLEAGPSFRLAGNLNGYNPSHYGVTAGVHYDYERTSANAVELVFGVAF